LPSPKIQIITDILKLNWYNLFRRKWIYYIRKH